MQSVYSTAPTDRVLIQLDYPSFIHSSHSTPNSVTFQTQIYSKWNLLNQFSHKFIQNIIRKYKVSLFNLMDEINYETQNP